MGKDTHIYIYIYEYPIVGKVLAILYAPVNRNIRCETLGFGFTQSFLAYK